jgi:hypothetical protein
MSDYLKHPWNSFKKKYFLFKYCRGHSIFMDFKFWKKKTPAIIENYKIIKKDKKGGKKIDKQQRKLAKMQEIERDS